MRGRTLVCMEFALFGTLFHFPLGLLHDVFVHRLRGLRLFSLTRLHARVEDPLVDLIVDLLSLAAQIYRGALGNFCALRRGPFLGFSRGLNGGALGELLLER
jgi:hypothetical protein